MTGFEVDPLSTARVNPESSPLNSWGITSVIGNKSEPATITHFRALPISLFILRHDTIKKEIQPVTRELIHIRKNRQETGVFSQFQ